MAKLKGMCRNEDCEMCDQIQEAEKSNFKCEKCGKDLIPFGNKTSEPGGGVNIRLIAIIAAAVILIALAICYFTGVFDGNTQKPIPAPTKDTTKVEKPIAEDTIALKTAKDESAEVEKAKAEAEKAKAEAEKAKAEAAKARANASVSSPAPVPATSTSGTLSLSYGKYTGAIKNGYPNGQGKLVYTTSRQINKYDTKGRTAQPGDYVQGVFVNGFFTIGKHYNSAGDLIESINVGVADDVYESK